ncbi:hypothetical protein D8682_22575 [Buttiauxella sp. 3AFRM03]|nr:hypothetical protein D8682_22575 [Buttiauxella sp. 3AFRM03]
MSNFCSVSHRRINVQDGVNIRVFIRHAKKNASGMTLIINVRLIMRYAERLTDVFLATYKSRYFHVE